MTSIHHCHVVEVSRISVIIINIFILQFSVRFQAMSSSGGTDNVGNLKYGQWVHFFVQYPILITKNKTTGINNLIKGGPLQNSWIYLY